jgi:hypothetical protein
MEQRYGIWMVTLTKLARRIFMSSETQSKAEIEPEPEPDE